MAWLAIALCPACSLAVQPSDADLAYAALMKTFWDPATHFFRRSETNSGHANFWLVSQVWDTVMDQYDRTHDEAVKRQINEIYDGFVKVFPDWTTNRFNDDILWWTIGCERAYLITNDERYLKQAKTNFDFIYDHYFDSALGGGLYWVKNGKSKNSCVNNPAIISAIRLSILLHDPAYLDRAKRLYQWEKSTLTDGNGKVFDSIHFDDKQQANVIARFSLTYNQGTVIGAGVLLYQQTGDRTYLDDAIETAQWTKGHLCVGDDRILPDEHQGDGGAFKGIFIRYMKRLIVDGGHAEFLPWMQANADAAWRNRRVGDDLMGSDWSKPTGSRIECQTDASAVAAILNFAVEPKKN